MTELDDSEVRILSKLNALPGSTEPRWVVGLLTMLEDGHYYIEDSTLCCKLNFSELEFVEPDAFFSENCVVIAEGTYQYE
jgi:DNA polymerase epsilon subunit 2